MYLYKRGINKRNKKRGCRCLDFRVTICGLKNYCWMHFTSVLYIPFQYIRLYGVFRWTFYFICIYSLFILFSRFFLCFDLFKDQCYISLVRALPNAYNSNFDEDKCIKIKNKDFYQIYNKKKLVPHSFVFYYAWLGMSSN